MKLPKILASHIIRSSAPKKEHGGLYLVDLETSKYECVLNWCDPINWHGRGSERGLRGIAFYKNRIFVATSNSILMLNRQFQIKGSFSNYYLKSCHEIYAYKNILYIASTGFDSIISFDLNKKEFIEGICIRGKKIKRFNLNDTKAIKSNDHLHINNVFCNENGLFVSGTNITHLLLIKNKIIKYALSEKGTHNCRPLDKNRILFNNTKNNCIVVKNIKTKINEKVFNIHKINSSKLKYVVGDKIARQPFGRGLAIKRNILIGGSSPGMISVYNMRTDTKIKDIIMTNDIRLSIHGLEIYE